RLTESEPGSRFWGGVEKHEVDDSTGAAAANMHNSHWAARRPPSGGKTSIVECKDGADEVPALCRDCAVAHGSSAEPRLEKPAGSEEGSRSRSPSAAEQRSDGKGVESDRSYTGLVVDEVDVHIDAERHDLRRRELRGAVQSEVKDGCYGWRAYLAKHNKFVKLSAEVARAAMKAGAAFENSFERGMKQSPHFRLKFRGHVPLWIIMPQMRELVLRERVEWVSFPQCAFRGKYQKWTALLAVGPRARGLRAEMPTTRADLRAQCPRETRQDASPSLAPPRILFPVRGALLLITSINSSRMLRSALVSIFRPCATQPVGAVRFLQPHQRALRSLKVHIPFVLVVKQNPRGSLGAARRCPHLIAIAVIRTLTRLVRATFSRSFNAVVITSAVLPALQRTHLLPWGVGQGDEPPPPWRTFSYALLADTSTFEFSRTAADEIADFPVGLSAPECLFEEVARLRSLPVPRAFVDRGHQLQDLAQGWQLF
ncbi:MAG: hypothetical protein SGPRY_008466, partial [Prymnesium sp.]